MHEHSLVRSLVGQVQEIARKHAAISIDEVVIAVGPLSGVEPLLLNSAFSRIASGELFAHVRFTIEETPLTIRCESCQLESELVNFVFICAHCGSVSTRVISGEGVLLRRVKLRWQRTEGSSRANASDYC
jgi:hydrogenase nickel incorporation protein HypA/HybF